MSEDARTLYLVDGSGFIYRAFFALERARLTSPQGVPTGAVYAFTQMLLKLLDDLAAERLAIVFDAKGPTFRNQVYADYKAHRPPMPDALAAQLPYIDRVVAALRVPVLREEGVEADDVIATVTRIARERGYEVVIVSADKDLMQLVRPGVAMLDTLEDRRLGPAEVEEKWGVPPAQLGDLLALMGDASDNVPGVEGVGAKTAAKLLHEHGSLAAVLRARESLAPRLREAFARAGERPLLARELVTLREGVPVAEPGAGLERYHPGPTDVDALVALCAELNFRSLLERLQPRAEIDRSSYRTVDTADALEDVVEKCRAAGAFAVDTETTSLDPSRAELVGISLAAHGMPACYIPIGHVAPGGEASNSPLGPLGLAVGGAPALAAPPQLAKERVLERLRPLFDDPGVAKYAQNYKYDLAVLLRAGVTLRGVACDPMIASFLLDASRPSHGLKELCEELLGRRLMHYEDVAGKGRSQVTFDRVPIRKATEYSAEDAEGTLLLAGRLCPRVAADPRLAAIQNEIELPLAGVLARMELRGVRIDTEHLGRLGRRISEGVAGLEEEMARQVGRRVNLASPKQLAELLFNQLELPVLKRNKTGPSTDADVLEELQHHHPVVGKILEHRTLTKLRSTYVEALPPLVNPRTGRVHTSFNQIGAVTGRISSQDPGLQNIPVRTELGREIRRAFVTDPGWILLSLDYSQIELRILAHLSEDEVLVDAFRRGEDVHARTAREVFGLPAEQITAEHRRIAKAVNFGVIYGQGDVGLAKNLGIEREKARAYIDGYFDRYAGVARYMERAIAEARERGHCETLRGRRRPLPELQSQNGRLRAAAERMARNTPIQGTAADILKIAMVRVGELLERRALRAHLLLTVHDELLLECPEEEADSVEAAVRQAMEGALPLRVPLVVDAGRGATWADAH